MRVVPSKEKLQPGNIGPLRQRERTVVENARKTREASEGIIEGER
jgi:hypothetical protein